MLYVAVSDRPINTKAFIQMHDEAFSYFEGVTEECVYDQTKLVALKEEFREVWFNEAFYQYATVARFDVRVCEGYDPESKGKIEAGVKYVKNNFLYGEEFTDFAALTERRLQWIEEANLRIHGSTKKRPQEEYKQQEKAMMRAYLRPFFLAEADTGACRGVDKTSLISYKANNYSVPMQYQSSTVRVKEEGTTVVIRDNASLAVIATHALCERKGEIIKNTNHYRDHAQLISEKEAEIAERIGKENAGALCTIIKRTSPKIYKDQLAGLLQVLKKYEDTLYEAISALVKRPRLTVSFMRDFLGAFYSQRHLQVKEETRIPSPGILSAYGAVVPPTGKEA
jgi:hypothetical protein